MKLSKLSVACGLALAALGGQAYGQAAFDPADETIYLSGATAPDGFLVTIATNLFDPGFHRYQDDNGTPGNFTDDGRAWNAFFGTIKTTDPTIPLALQGKKIYFIKRSRGGSVWGVDPTARANRIAVIDRNSTTCVLNSGIQRCPIIGIDPGLPGYTDPGNPGIPNDFGVSDVEPAMFKGPYNVEFGQTQLTAEETARMTVKAVNSIMMGMSATAAVPATTNLARADYGAILSNQIQDWSQIDTGITTGYTQTVVCRRVQGSGTQTSYNWFFNNFPCQLQFAGTVAPARMTTDSFSGIINPGATGSASDPFMIDPTAGYTVVENSGSGNVRDCLTRAQANTVHKFVGDDGKNYSIRFDFGHPSTPPADVALATNPGQGPFRAIGVLSLDSYFATSSPDDPTGATAWSFRNMDGAGIYDPATQAQTAGPGTGIQPSKTNLLLGRWDFAVELAMQYRVVNVTNAHGDVVPALAGLKKTFTDEFIRRAGDPAFNTQNHVAALPPTYTPALDPAGVPTNNVARGSRLGNTCQPLNRIF